MTDVAAALGAAGHRGALRRVKLLSWLTVTWLLIDGVIGMTAGITANSVALIGWGLDCGVQAAAAVVILWRFTGSRIHSAAAERFAQRAVGVSFLLLAPYIVVMSVDHLATGNVADGSRLGAALAATDALLMPVIGRAKQRVGADLGSCATRSEGRQNVLCAYLSMAVLVGLAANVVFGLWWCDPIVALLVAIVVVQGGVATWRGERDGC